MSPRTSIRLLLLLACLGAVTARVTAQDAVPEKLRPAYAKLQASSAGDWLARVEQSSGLIRELWGARASAPGRDSRETAEAFLKDHAELFGMKADGSDRRELGRLLSAVGERFVYQQMAAGLPVLGRKSLVSVDSRLRVQAVANRFGPVQKVAGLDAPVSREHAIALALAASGTGTRLRAPAQAELAVLADGDSGEAAWRVVLACRAPLADWEVVVSAKDGRVLRKRSLLVAATGSGKVFDPNPVVALGDRTLRDGGDADGPQFAAAYRVVALPRLDGSGLLRGQWADVHSQTNEVKGVPGPFTRALEPTLNFLYPRSDKRFEETNIYYHLDAIQTYIQQTIGVSNANARVTTANAHEDDVFNSFYSPATRSIYYEDGAGGVDLAEDSDVVVHEYGHAVQDNQVPGWGSVEEGGAMGEGFADFLACVYSSTKTVNAGGPDPDPACVGEWAFSGRGNCLRRTDGTKHYPQDLDSEVHDDGEIWSACLWQIRGLYGNTIALRLVLESHFLLDDFADFFAGANAILTADDNLYGGTHKSAIRDIFIARGILDPATFPAVTQLVPDSLDTDKGGQLGIVGSHFAGATAVALAGPVGRVLTPSSVTDARVDVTIPAGLLAGQYTVKVSTPAGLNTKSPPLSMQFPDDHTNSCTGLGAADRVVVGGNGSSGTIDSSGDRDLFSVDIPAAGTYRFGVIGFSLNDPYLTLLDQDCSKILAQNDDDGPGLDPLIVHVFARPGTYFLRARDFSTRTGTYRVAAGGAPAALQIESITPSWPKLSVGQTIAVSVVVKNTGMTAASLSAESLTIAGAAVSAAPLAVSVSLPGGGVTTSFQFTVSGLSLGRATLTSAVFTAASVVDLTAVPVAANRATPASVDVVKPEPTLVLETLTATRNAIAVGEVLQATVTMRNEGTIRANVTTPRLVTTRATLTPSTPSLSTSIDPMGGRRQFTFDVTGASVGLGTITSATLAATDAQSGKPAPITTNRAAAANVIVGTPTPLLRIVSIDTSRSQIDVGQPLAVTVKFKNEGSGPADVSSTRLVFSGSSLAAAASTTGFSIAGFGATASVTFGGLGVSAGSCTISSATVTATNPSLGGGPVGIGANSAAARIVTVQVPAAVSVTSVTATAQTVSRRQTGVRVTVRIANTGEASMGAPAVELTSVLRVGANSAGYTVTRLSAQPAVLAAGQTAYVTYNVDVLDTAPLGATNVAAEVRAKDGNTQEALSAGGSVLTSWTVKAAAKLAVGPIAAARSTVIRGDTGVLVQVPVSNTAPV
ncbi:MAG: M36 family metallopeptidase, partial [Candidatus Wallbacteria bacterium]|nr:M36 family metallopeptidase [Candidatus Wallbacteria bacterium]